MKEILQNLALIDLLNFCEENDIPANGRLASRKAASVLHLRSCE
jgi:hypothetical protein